MEGQLIPFLWSGIFKAPLAIGPLSGLTRFNDNDIKVFKLVETLRGPALEYHNNNNNNNNICLKSNIQTSSVDCAPRHDLP